MDVFNQVITAVNNVVWSPAMLVLLGGVAIWFTFVMKGLQFTGIRNMFRHLTEHGDSEETGLSAFQALATTVGGRVGTGNIAGTATAIFFGGPGALFWMWMAALLGAATGMVECMLGQAYKDKNLGELIGGPAYYMTRGLKHKKLGRVLGILFSIAVLIGPGFLLPAMQTQTAASAMKNALHIPMWATGLFMVVIVGIVIMGGIRRIGELAEHIAPLMCGIYFLMALAILFMHIKNVPAVFGAIFTSAFGKNSVFGSIVGTAFSYGIQRGFFSNDAGNGMSPIISSTTDTSHPVKQGLAQGLSVYIGHLSYAHARVCPSSLPAPTMSQRTASAKNFSLRRRRV